MMQSRRLFFVLALLVISSFVIAQVPVRSEPRHKTIFENNYLRLLDVHIPPGDTSLFHVHSTPSFFLILSNTLVSAQVMGQDWTTSQNVAGVSWYKSFKDDTLIHRVTNCDTVPFHVTDVEILDSYGKDRKIKPLPFDLLFENERIIVYGVSNSSGSKKVISRRGPVIAQLVEGGQILYHDKRIKEKKLITKGGYLYIEPESTFYFTITENEKFNLVLLEIK